MVGSSRSSKNPRHSARQEHFSRPAALPSISVTDANVLRFPPDQRDPRWFELTPVVVRWVAQREPQLPIVSATGTILVERDEPLEELDQGDEDAHYEEAGEIRIAKPLLHGADVNMAMDALSADHEYLAGALLDGDDYDEAFYAWFEGEFGRTLGGDPIFVLDLTIVAKHRDPDGIVAAHAALDALAAFGGAGSPLVTFDVGGVDPELRKGLADVGLWSWVHALRAKRWNHVYVAVRP